MSLLGDRFATANASGERADWQSLWQALAGTRLVVPIESTGAATLSPRLISAGGVEAVQAFERMESFAAMLDEPGECAEVDGAELAGMLAGHSLALAVSIDGLADPIMVGEAALGWIAATWGADVERTIGAGVVISAAAAPTPEMVTLLGATVAALGGDCREAWLVTLTPVDGPGELTLVLGLSDGARAVEAELAETVTRALQAGTDRPVAVACADPCSALIDRARRHGIGIGG